MTGDVLLAGTEHNDGTVTVNDKLRLTDANLGKEVMSGDVFLAGTKQNDGTVLANGDLRLTGLNLKGVMPFEMTAILPYNGLATNTGAWCLQESIPVTRTSFSMSWYRSNNNTSSHTFI